MNQLVEAPPQLILCVISLLGSSLGSFGATFAIRFYLNQDLLEPRSSCDSCNYAIRWYANIPILSFIFLRGRCSHCNAQISRFQFASEIFTTLLFIAVYLLDLPWTSQFLLFLIAFVTAPLAFIDLRMKRLPNFITLPITIISIVIFVFHWIFITNSWFIPIITAFAIFLFYISLHLLTRRNFGRGDVKLSLPLAIALVTIDVKIAISSNIIAFYLAGFYALYKYCKGARRTYIAFGPFMLFGFWAATLLPIAFSENIVNLWIP